MKFEDLNLPEEPNKGYFINHDGQAVSIDDLPLISHITDNLYVGGCMNGVDLEDFFSHVFSLYMWEQYTFGPNTELVEVKMYDSAAHPVDVETVDEMSDRVVEALAKGGNVLVHCQAGINRSNLVATAALVKMGMTPAEAIGLLREKRSRLVLSNRTFENFLINELA